MPTFSRFAFPNKTDFYTFEAVDGVKCNGKAMKQTCKALKEFALTNGVRYFPICVALFDEEKYELEKTIYSICRNFDYIMNHLAWKANDLNFQKEIARTIPVIVPIFDGVLQKKEKSGKEEIEAIMSESIRNWLAADFPEMISPLKDAFEYLQTGLGVTETAVQVTDTMSKDWSATEPLSGVGKVEVCGGVQLMRWKVRLPRLEKEENGEVLSFNLFENDLDTTESEVNSVLHHPDNASVTSGSQPHSEDEGPNSHNLEEGINSSKVRNQHPNQQNVEDGTVIQSVSTLSNSSKGRNRSKDFVDDITINSDKTVREPLRVFGANGNNEINYFLCPIIKRSNRRKHNTHDFFFKFCQEISSYVDYCLLTDCGTTYHETCILRLWYAAYSDANLIGVTARQRVEKPNEYFLTCKDSKWSCFRGNHTEPSLPCWKCWANYYLSPCPLQGFEFEATLITNTLMFNLVEALPVMPGPCQLFNWKLMVQFNVPDDYMKLLNSEEKDENYKSNLPLDQPAKGLSTEDQARKDLTLYNTIKPLTRLAEDRILSFVAIFNSGLGTKWISGATFYYEPCLTWEKLLLQRRRWIDGTLASFIFYFSGPAKTRIRACTDVNWQQNWFRNQFTIFFMWGLQLVQFLLLVIGPSVFGSAFYLACGDLINRLSSDAAVATEFPTSLPSSAPAAYPSFAPSAQPTFFNETVLPSSQPTSQPTINMTFWPSSSPSGQPSSSPSYYPYAADTSSSDTNSVIGIPEYLTGGFFLLYASWMIYSHHQAKIPELLSQCLAIISGLFMMVIYASIILEVHDNGFSFISIFILLNLLQPMIITFFFSPRSSLFYLKYSPWFLYLIIFFLIFIPAYALARLHDTTWGNRDTDMDQALNAIKAKILKQRNFYLIIGFIVLNIILSFAFIWAIKIFQGNWTLVFSLILFSVLFIQFIFCILAIVIEWLRKVFPSYFPKTKDKGSRIRVNPNRIKMMNPNNTNQILVWSPADQHHRYPPTPYHMLPGGGNNLPVTTSMQQPQFQFQPQHQQRNDGKKSRSRRRKNEDSELHNPVSDPTPSLHESFMSQLGTQQNDLIKDNP